MGKFYDVLGKKLLITVSKLLIESIIRHGIVIWGGLYQHSLTPLMSKIM